MNEIHQRKAAVAQLSVLSNSALVILKLTVGLMIGSVSVISEAIHSAVDLVAALIALFAVKTSAKPADRDHPFGHGKFENASGTIEALLIFAAAGWIIFEAVKKLLHPEPLETIGLGVGVMLISATLNVFVSQRLFKVGRETDSVALKADAWHLRTDVYTSAGVMAALAVIWIAGAVAPGVDLGWVDPAAAIGVALLIVRAAFRLTVQSARDLLDVSLPPEEEDLIREHITAFTPTVRGYHRLRTRKSGSERFVEFHMLVDENMSVGESHRITQIIANAIREHYPDTSVTIHIEPCGSQCSPRCTEGCLLDGEARQSVRSRQPSPPRDG